MTSLDTHIEAAVAIALASSRSRDELRRAVGGIVTATYQAGLRRGLELAKEHALVRCDDPFFGGEIRIDWSAADVAVDKECG